MLFLPSDISNWQTSRNRQSGWCDSEGIRRQGDRRLLAFETLEDRILLSTGAEPNTISASAAVSANPLTAFDSLAGIAQNIPFVSDSTTESVSAAVMDPESELTRRDAELLAMEISGALLPPTELTEQIAADLEAIRSEFPVVSEIHHHPRWKPGELLVGLTDEAFEQFQQGEYRGLDNLNTWFGAVNIRTLGGIPALYLQFDQEYNPEVLATFYSEAEGVRHAGPNGIIGDGNTIEGAPSTYTFSRGWGDCPAGCISRHFWVFTVENGSVTLVEEFGASLDQEPPDFFIPTPTDGPKLLPSKDSQLSKPSPFPFFAIADQLIQPDSGKSDRSNNDSRDELNFNSPILAVPDPRSQLIPEDPESADPTTSILSRGTEPKSDDTDTDALEQTFSSPDLLGELFGFGVLIFDVPSE